MRFPVSGFMFACGGFSPFFFSKGEIYLNKVIFPDESIKIRQVCNRISTGNVCSVKSLVDNLSKPFSILSVAQANWNEINIR